MRGSKTPVHHRCRLALTMIVALSVQQLISIDVGAQTLNLDPKQYQHLVFNDIKPTNYELKDNILQAKVEQSSSALILGFKTIRIIKGFSALWRSEGTLNIAFAKHEEEKTGDDARFRIGFILSGPEPIIPFLAPAWIKALGNMLTLPGDALIYYILGAKHPFGTTWPNPYNDEIRCMSAPHTLDQDGWMKSSVTFDKPINAVGLWLMADGDNSHSQFVTKVRSLTLIQ